LIERVLAERVKARRKKQNCLLALHATKLIERLNHGIEQTRLVKSGHKQLRDRLLPGGLGGDTEQQFLESLVRTGRPAGLLGNQRGSARKAEGNDHRRRGRFSIHK